MLRPSRLSRWIQAIWFGSGLFLMAVAAPAAFRYAHSSTAADIVGAMLARWHYIALLAPLVLLAIEWRRQRQRVIAVLFVAVLLAAGQSVLDLRIRMLRAASPAPIGSLAQGDPLRRQFGILHGMSMLLQLLDVVAAAVAIAVEPDRD